jgi:hypothetical protein
VNLKGDGHPLLLGLEQREYGSDIDPAFFTQDIRWMSWPKDTGDYRFSPVFFGNDPDATVLGNLKGFNQPGLLFKDLGKRKSIYSSAPILHAPLLRNIFEQAGVHVYSKSNDLIYANNTFVSFTANQAGRQKLLLPKSSTLTDAFSGEKLAENVKSYEFEAKQYETRIFRLG